MIPPAFLPSLSPLRARFERLTARASSLRFWRRAGPEVDASQLVAAAKYGDPEAFDALVERYAPRLHAVARRMVGESGAADVVQDAFVAAFERLDRFRGDAAFSSYLHTIVVNRCRRVLRKRRPLTVEPEALERRPAADPDPEATLDAALLREALDAAFAELPTEFREALALREYGGLPYAEIAGLLGVAEGTVKSRIARGRALLRDGLERRGVRP